MTNNATVDVHAFLSHLGVNGEEDDSLEHYGVKGMRWGVRRDLQKMAPGDRKAYIDKIDSKWLTKVNTNQGKKVQRVMTRSSRRIKNEVTKPLAKEYSKKDLKKNPGLRAELNEKVRVRTEQILREETHRQFGISPSRLQRVVLDTSLFDSHGAVRAYVTKSETNAKLQKQALKIHKSDRRKERREAREAAKAEVKHALEDEGYSEDDVLDILEDLSFIITFDEDGLPDEVLNPLDLIEHGDEDSDSFLIHYDAEAYLEHFGVKGMKWGVRKDDPASAAEAERHSKLVSGLKACKTTEELDAYIDKVEQTSGEAHLKVRSQEDLGGGKTRTEVTTYKNTHIQDSEWQTLPERKRYETHVFVTKSKNPDSRTVDDHLRTIKRISRGVKIAGAAAAATSAVLQMSDENEEELYHYGIKGMQWGVRRPDGPDGTVSSRVSSKSSSKKSTSSAGGSSNKKSSSGRQRGLKRAKAKEIAAKPEVQSATTSAAKLAINSAIPALMSATGVGAPLALGVSLTVKILMEPAVQEAISPAKDYVKSVVKFSGDVTISQMPTKTTPVVAAAKKGK